jgi:meiotically up-regulated gene 157 (Mug157) protein
LQCQGDCIWPLGLIMEALTAKDPAREREILCVLIRTTDGQRLMHEGFNMDDPSEYNRDLFGWANSLFASWVLGSTALRDPLAPLVCE